MTRSQQLLPVVLSFPCIRFTLAFDPDPAVALVAVTENEGETY